MNKFIILCIVFCCRQKQQEIVNLEAQIHTKIETQKKAGIELDSTCQICLRTKFADGIGHICNYCNVRCCAKCGGKVALRSNKVCKIDRALLLIHSFCLWLYSWGNWNTFNIFKHFGHSHIWSQNAYHSVENFIKLIE